VACFCTGQFLEHFVGCHLLPVDDLTEFYCRVCSLIQPFQLFQVCVLLCSQKTRFTVCTHVSVNSENINAEAVTSVVACYFQTPEYLCQKLSKFDNLSSKLLSIIQQIFC